MFFGLSSDFWGGVSRDTMGRERPMQVAGFPVLVLVSLILYGVMPGIRLAWFLVIAVIAIPSALICMQGLRAPLLFQQAIRPQLGALAAWAPFLFAQACIMAGVSGGLLFFVLGGYFVWYRLDGKLRASAALNPGKFWTIAGGLILLLMWAISISANWFTYADGELGRPAGFGRYGLALLFFLGLMLTQTLILGAQVLMVAHNAQSFVEQCIRKALNQAKINPTPANIAYFREKRQEDVAVLLNSYLAKQPTMDDGMRRLALAQLPLNTLSLFLYVPAYYASAFLFGYAILFKAPIWIAYWSNKKDHEAQPDDGQSIDEVIQGLKIEKL